MGIKSYKSRVARNQYFRRQSRIRRDTKLWAMHRQLTDRALKMAPLSIELENEPWNCSTSEAYLFDWTIPSSELLGDMIDRADKLEIANLDRLIAEGRIDKTVINGLSGRQLSKLIGSKIREKYDSVGDKA